MSKKRQKSKKKIRLGFLGLRVRGYKPKAPTLLGKIGLQKQRVRAHYKRRRS